MAAPLEAWDERLRGLFGLSLMTHPARLRDGLRAACTELGVKDDAELLSRVDRGDREAKTALARALTIGETYFFREPLHFDLVRSKLLPEALARGMTPVVMISAACSSGEEAYSLAITAREVLGAEAAGRVRVLGFDVNERSVTAARRGVYRAWSLRGVSDEIKRRWFEHGGDTWSVIPEARSLTTFERRNLVDAVEALPPSSADIVFCRNVLIYFDDASVAHVLRQLAAALRPSGSLVVSSAEAGLLATAGLGAHQLGDTWVHTRGELRAAAPAAPLAPTSSTTSSLPPPAERRATTPRRRTAAAPATPAMPTTPAAPTVAVDALGAAIAHLEHGWAILDTTPALAAEDARRAILLDRTLAAAHILAASAALAQADHGGARRALRHARRYLTTTSPTEIVRGSGGATAREMEAYCARLERALEGRDR